MRVASLGLAALCLFASHVQAQPSPTQSPDLEQAVTAYREGRFDDALSQAENLANRGNGRAATLVGFILERGLTGQAAPARALGFYRRGVRAGDTDAMLALARLAMTKQGDATPAEAMTVLQRALALGRQEAASPLGDLFLSGAAGPRDSSR
ncbi:MAG: hypothetical protein RL186_750, partial [Pseudomonadota bacterium]